MLLTIRCLRHSSFPRLSEAWVAEAGAAVGSGVGAGDGAGVGAAVGCCVGAGVGAGVGVAVGFLGRSGSSSYAWPA